MGAEAPVAIFGPQKLLVDLIWTCCNIQIEKEDGLPNQICFPCEIKLESFAHFRFACAQTDMALKRKIDKNFKFKKELPDIDENSNFSLHNLFETKSDESHDKSKQNR
ncbi:uncharacterized protein LOC143909294 isoform X1 [Arctopsyche grandis]|uniref:uncharacterized protein LOC143909294 isoform X1 n=1 Tax=Arctopsyche grandis TaxID=121162 RepID=UPI00406D7BD0